MEDRVGIVTFTVENIDNETISRELADYSAISVRRAAFCAHPYVRRLTKEEVTFDEDGRPCHPKGMVRVSFGIYNSEKDVDCLVETIEKIIRMERLEEKGLPIDSLQGQTDLPFAHLYKIPYDRG